MQNNKKTRKAVEKVDVKSVEIKDFKEMSDSEKSAALYRKIYMIMANLDKVGKSGYNKTQQYNYTTEEDVIELVKPKLIEHKLLLIPTTKSVEVRDVASAKGGVNPVTRVIVSYKLCDIETGHSIDLEFIGEGYDPLDKGIYKAYTGANKYFLAKTFQIATSDDPEDELGQSAPQTQQAKSQSASQPNRPQGQEKPEPKPEGMSEAQRKMIFAIVNNKNLDAEKVKEHVKKQFKLESFMDLEKHPRGKAIAKNIIDTLNKMERKPDPEPKPEENTEQLSEEELAGLMNI